MLAPNGTVSTLTAKVSIADLDEAAAAAMALVAGCLR